MQAQAATGQRVQFPEDDPSAIRRVLELQTESKSLHQYENNLSRLETQSEGTFSAIKALKTLSDRAGEIATLADGTDTQDSLNDYATQVNQLIHQAVQLANTKLDNNYIFAGTASDQPPFVTITDANGEVTSVSYQGNESVAESEITSVVTISVQVLGVNNSGSGPRGLFEDSRTGADFFNHLISLRDHLVAGDTNAIVNTDFAQFDQDEQNIISQIATNGALKERLLTAKSIASDRGFSVEKLISQDADADLAQTLVRLSETQTAYTAALQSGGLIINQSLLDYIR